MSRFDWSDAPSVLAHSYGDLAVHPNVRGDVVIRQKDDFDTDDQVVVCPLDTAERLADAIRQASIEGRAIREELQAEGDNQQPEPEQQTRLALPAPQPRPTVTKPREGAHHG
jgi:hypothetical protein